MRVIVLMFILFAAAKIFIGCQPSNGDTFCKEVCEIRKPIKTLNVVGVDGLWGGTQMADDGKTCSCVYQYSIPTM